MNNKIKECIENLKVYVQNGELSDSERLSLASYLMSVVSCSPKVDSCLPNEEFEPNSLLSMNLFDCEDVGSDISLENGKSEIKELTPLEISLSEKSVSIPTRKMKSSLVEKTKTNFMNIECYNEYLERKSSHSLCTKNSLIRRSKFQEILKSNENFIFNQRCRNVLSTLLLLGDKYLEFIDYSLSTESENKVKFFDCKDFNSFKTREIFTELFNFFDISFSDLKLLIEKCFNRYNMNSYSDFRFGDDFEYFWKVCTNRELFKCSSYKVFRYSEVSDCISSLDCSVEDIYATSVNTSLLEEFPSTKLSATYCSLLKHSAFPNLFKSCITVPLLRIWKSLESKSKTQSINIIDLLNEKQKVVLCDIFENYSFEEVFNFFQLGSLAKEINFKDSVYMLETLYNMYKNM